MCVACVTLYSLSLPLSCVLCLCRFDFNFPRSLSLRSSFSVFLPSSKQGSPAHHGGSLILAFCLFFTFLFPCSLARSLSYSLTGPLTFLFSPQTPPPRFLFPSLPRECDGSQRPAQMRVISESILTDSELSLEFVATL